MIVVPSRALLPAKTRPESDRVTARAAGRPTAANRKKKTRAPARPRARPRFAATGGSETRSRTP